MGHTNETTNLHLPQFIGSDKPTWLGDINGAFQNIDNGYATIGSTASGAAATAENAATVAQSASTAAASAQTAASGAATDAATAISTANNAAETANNAQSTAVLAKNKADEALAAVNRGSVSVTADGVKTYAALLAELYALIEPTKMSIHSKLLEGNSIYNALVIDTTTNGYRFAITTFNATVSRIYSAGLNATACERLSCATTYSTGTTAFADNSNDVVTNGVTFTLVY